MRTREVEIEFLYGRRFAEEMFSDLSSAVEDYETEIDWEDEDEDNWSRLMRFEKWSVLPPGRTEDAAVMTGQEVAVEVAERFAEECGMEVLGEQYMKMAENIDVVRAFQEAIASMVDYQSYRCSDRLVSTIEVNLRRHDYTIIHEREE